MPRVNIYIRQDDWEAWDNISDKPSWIHEGLTTGFVVIPARPQKPITKDSEVVSPAGSRGDEQDPAVVRNEPSRASSAPEPSGQCKNGHPFQPGRDRCITPKCKYSVYG